MDFLYHGYIQEPLVRVSLQPIFDFSNVLYSLDIPISFSAITLHSKIESAIEFIRFQIPITDSN
jgi:hypothetical protein